MRGVGQISLGMHIATVRSCARSVPTWQSDAFCGNCLGFVQFGGHISGVGLVYRLHCYGCSVRGAIKPTLSKGQAMERSFKFESTKHDNILTAVIEFSCSDADGADCTIDSLILWDDDAQRRIELNSLADADLERLESRAQRVADEYAVEAYQEHCEGEADYYADFKRDGA